SGESNPVAIGAQLDVGGFSTPALASLGLREATRRGVVEAGAQTVVVNVPGPTHRLTMLGRPMLELHPAPPLAGGVRVSIGVYSYLDTLTFGVTADRRSVASANVVIGGIRRALDELIDPKQETKNNANS
ncbi:MAG: WS/DGAT domain-containing protein, partial [Acidimicrobiales bacterium]